MSKKVRKRRTIVEMWEDDGVFEHKLSMIEGLTKHGLPLEYIAKELGISATLMYSLAKNDERIKRAVEFGRGYLYNLALSVHIQILESEQTTLKDKIESANVIMRRYDHQFRNQADKDYDDYILTRGKSTGGETVQVHKVYQFDVNDEKESDEIGGGIDGGESQS